MDSIVAQHHRDQKTIARNVVSELAPLWELLDFHALEESTATWLKATRPVLERGFLVSQWTAAQFVETYRRTRLSSAEPLGLDLPNPLGVFTTPRVDKELSIKFMVSMKVTGPLHVAKSMPMPEDEAMYAGFSKSSGAAIRLVLNGGRGMVRMLADVDEHAVGVVGVADDDACPSCKFLTTPILKTDGARKMNAVAIGHDFCKCSAALVY